MILRNKEDRYYLSILNGVKVFLQMSSERTVGFRHKRVLSLEKTQAELSRQYY